MKNDFKVYWEGHLWQAHGKEKCVFAYLPPQLLPS